MMMGCVPPRPSPSRNDTAINSGTLSTSGINASIRPDSTMVTSSSLRSLKRRTTHGSIRRNKKIALPNEPSIRPMVEAENLRLAPWMGITKPYKSQHIDSSPLITKMRISTGLRSKSRARRLTVSVCAAGL